MSKVITNYLEHLNQESAYFGGMANRGAGFAKAALSGSSQTVKSMLTPKSFAIWTLGPPALFGAFRLAQRMTGAAPTKCGTFTKGPGREVCMARFKMNAEKQKLQVYTQLLASASSSGKATPQQLQSIKDNIEKSKSKVNHYTLQIKETLGEEEQIKESALVGFAASMIAGAIVSKAMFIAWRTSAAAFNSASRKCGVYSNGIDRDLCMNTIKLNALKQQFMILQKVLATCPKQKNPEKCNIDSRKRMEKLKGKIQLHQDNVTAYTNQKREQELKKNAESQL